MNSLPILPALSQPETVSMADDFHSEYSVPDSFRNGIAQVEMRLNHHRHPLESHLKNVFLKLIIV